MSLQDEQIHDFINKYRQGRITRRQALFSLSIVGGLTAANMIAPGLGTGSAFAQSGSPKRGGTLVAATIDKPVNLDPAFAELYSSMQVYQNIFSKLVNMAPDGTITPGLAKAWRQIDASTWEFDLVDNAWFHNDEKFTAHDVKYTFERLADPNLGAANLVFVSWVEGAEVVDDTTVRIITQPNWGGLLSALAAVIEIVNKKGIESHDPKLHPIGTGPFKFVEWVKDDHITLERWDKYFRPNQPYLDKLVFRAISDDTVRLTGLQTGELGWIEQVPLHRTEELMGDNRIKANPSGEYFPEVFELNSTKAPFDKIEVRQAIQWALNRDAITGLVWHGQASPSREPVSPSNPWFADINEYPGAPDMARAKALLEQAGYGDGLTISFAGQPQVPTQIKAGQMLQQQLKPLGINVEIQSFESARWFEEWLSKRFQVTSTYWSATADPAAHCVYPLYHSKSPWNFSGFDDSPELDEALDAFQFTVDPEERKKAYAGMMKIHQQQSPGVFQVNFRRTYWTQPDVEGVRTLPTLELRMEDAWINS